MIIKGNTLEAFLTSPPAGLRGILFFGPNEGRVREYARLAAKSVAPDLDDPFRVCQLTPADLKADPARLSDEAAAIAMTGGRRVVRISGVGDAHAESFVNFADNPAGDSLVVCEAGELARTSKLRKLFESGKSFAIMACYEESAADLERLVIDHLRQHGLRITSDARAYLLQCLGEDRLASRQELDKLVLYKWPRKREHASAATGDVHALGGKEVKDGRDSFAGHDTAGVMDTDDIPDTKDTGDIIGITDGHDTHGGAGAMAVSGGNNTADIREVRDSIGITDTLDARDIRDIYAIHDSNAGLVSLDDVIACIGDSTVQGLDGICDALGEGDLAVLDSQIARGFEAALTPVGILRAAGNHMMRLQLALSALSEGAGMDMALRSLRPPLNFKRTKSFQLQLRLWNLVGIGRALDLLLRAEAACKTTGAPDLSLCSQALLQTALIIRRKG